MKTGAVVLWLSILLANPSTAVPMQGFSELLDNQAQAPLDNKRSVEKTERAAPDNHRHRDRDREQRAALVASRDTGYVPGHIKTTQSVKGGMFEQIHVSRPKSGFRTVRLKGLERNWLPPDAWRVMPIPVKAGPNLERFTQELASGGKWK